MRRYPVSTPSTTSRTIMRNARDLWNSSKLRARYYSRGASLRKSSKWYLSRMSRSFLLLLIATCGTVSAQDASAEWKNLRKPGIKEVQVPFASIKPTATLKVGGTADWVLVTENAVWVASTKPSAVIRIDPATDKIVATVKVPGEACSGLASGFGSIWVPIWQEA